MVELPHVSNERRVDLAVSYDGLRNSLTLSASPFIHSALKFATGHVSSQIPQVSGLESTMFHISLFSESVSHRKISLHVTESHS